MDLRGPTSKGVEGKGKGEGGERENEGGEDRGREGREGERERRGRDRLSPQKKKISGAATGLIPAPDGRPLVKSRTVE